MHWQHDHLLPVTYFLLDSLTMTYTHMCGDHGCPAIITPQGDVSPVLFPCTIMCLRDACLFG